MSLISPVVNRITRKIETNNRILGIRTDLLERLIRTIRGDILPKVGLVIVSVFLLAAMFAPELAPHDPMAQDHPILQPPSLDSSTVLGTDSYGRDMLSRLMYGARVSLMAGLFATTLGGAIGITFGVASGFYGGKVDDVLMRIVDIMWAFPAILVAVILVTLWGRGMPVVIIAIAWGFVDDFARVTRSEVLAAREEEYILASRSLGLTNWRIMYEEILPNIIAPLIVTFTVYIARAMLTESTLSFLGLGVDLTTPTWGALLGQGRDFLTSAWWISILPGLAIVIVVLGVNFFGDAMRDAFDVKEDA